MSLTCRQQHVQLLKTSSNRRNVRWFHVMSQITKKTLVECIQCHEPFYAEHFADEPTTQTKCIECKLKE